MATSREDASHHESLFQDEKVFRGIGSSVGLNSEDAQDLAQRKRPESLKAEGEISDTPSPDRYTRQGLLNILSKRVIAQEEMRDTFEKAYKKSLTRGLDTYQVGLAASNAAMFMLRNLDTYLGHETPEWYKENNINWRITDVIEGRAEGGHQFDLYDNETDLEYTASKQDMNYQRTPEDQTADRMLAEKVLKKLPEKMKSALIARHLEGRSYVGVANKIPPKKGKKTTEENARQLCSRAQQRNRRAAEALGEKIHDEEEYGD